MSIYVTIILMEVKDGGEAKCVRRVGVYPMIYDKELMFLPNSLPPSLATIL